MLPSVPVLLNIACISYYLVHVIINIYYYSNHFETGDEEMPKRNGRGAREEAPVGAPAGAAELGAVPVPPARAPAAAPPPPPPPGDLPGAAVAVVPPGPAVVPPGPAVVPPRGDRLKVKRSK